MTEDVLETASPEALAWAHHLATLFGPATVAVLHYGSRAQGVATRADSPFDFFVLVSGYPEAYASARARGAGCRPRRATLLARILPPNAMAVERPGNEGVEAKCLILSREDFAGACSTRARDHFVTARMIQRVLLVWSRDAPAAQAVLASVADARRHTFAWVRPFLPARFELEDFCRALIAVSYASEIRAEGPERIEKLLRGQHEVLHRIYGPLLEGLVEQGALARDDNGYRLAHPPGLPARMRVRHYFRVSKVRTTLRLLKHPFLYDGWLDYLLRKIERHTGERIELTARERRHPLVFLWPRALRYVRSRPQRTR